METRDAQAKVNRIIDISCSYWSIEKNVLLSKNKTGILPQYKAMLTYFIIEQQLNLKLVEIAELLQLSDHSSIIHRRELMNDYKKQRHPILHQYHYYKKYLFNKLYGEYDGSEYFEIINEIKHANY